jgi:hypothetical protein
MNIENEYRKIVDTVQPGIPISDRNQDIDDFKIVYSYYLMPITNRFSREEIEKHIINEISKIISNKNFELVNISELRKLQDQIILQNIINDIPLEPYYSIIYTFLGNLNRTPKVISFKYIDDWKKIIKLLKEFLIIYSYFQEYKNEYYELLPQHNRIIVVGESAKYFKLKGYEIKVTEGDVSLNPEDYKNIAIDIENSIKSIGGLNVITSIFKSNEHIYDKELFRFNFIRKLGGFDKKEADIPVGYLLNISVKHLFPELAITNIENVYNEILEKSRKFCSLYNVQYYSQFENMFINPEFLPIYLHEIILFDSLFTFFQFRPDDLNNFLEKIFSWVDLDEFKSKIGWDLNDGIKIISYIIVKYKNKLIPASVFKDDIYKHFKQHISYTIDLILNAFSHDYLEVNNKYLLPHDTQFIDFQFKPLIKISNHEYILINSSICSMSCYETIISLIRDNIDKNVDDIIGSYTEIFLREELKKKNIIYNYGEYVNNIYESDLIIESSDTIIVIEIKKKPLKRISRSGDDVNILIDISDSLVDSLIQINRHEIELLKNGKLELESGIVYLNDRNIEKISLSLLDYGSLQDRAVIEQILQIFMTNKYNPFDKKYQDYFNKLNEKCSVISEQMEEIIRLNPEKTKRPFFDCWFLSLPQLLILLNESNSNDDFKNNLFRSRHITTGTNDFYFQHSYLKKIKSNGK